MAGATGAYSRDRAQFSDSTVTSQESRPLPLRTYSESEASPIECDARDGHSRRKSTFSFSNRTRLNSRRNEIMSSNKLAQGIQTGQNIDSAPNGLSAVREQHESGSLRPCDSRTIAANILTPPVTPIRGQKVKSLSDATAEASILSYDFLRIDYELDRARAIGRGLWSSVYLAQPMLKSPNQPAHVPLSPPTSPERERLAPPCSLFAVKTPARPDSRAVFSQEARVLTRLQLRAGCNQYVVPFHGLDPRNSSLVFEAVIGGSLGNLTSRLKVMTEVTRHLEVRSLFPGLASDLVTGLKFIHNAGLIHADIKPANVLLDISQHYSLPKSVIRARYIDFSAAFVSGTDSAANAGGTWAFMAPEQMRIQKDLNTPTYASDVWSLGITLLSILVGGSPYSSACGDNVFLLREAIKSGDPLGFARMDPVIQKRMAACQDFVDCCRLALQKDRERRTDAAAWVKWLECQQLGS